jgi:DNA-binding XRE family transcriptional regulator
MSVTQEDITEWVRAVRGKLGLSQSQLADLLGVSARAIQSYEQGWRTPPRPVTSHLMTVLALYSEHPTQSPPCWNLTGCSSEKRRGCAAWSVGHGRFCWLLSGRACGNRRTSGSAAGPQQCVGCIVVKNLLEGPSRPTVAVAGLANKK